MRTLTARDVFEQLRQEGENSERKPEVTTSVMKGLIEGFVGYLSDAHLIYVQNKPYPRYHPSVVSEIMASQLGDIRNSDVEKLSLLMEQFSEHPNFADEAGRYLTACIDQCVDDKIFVDTRRWKSDTRDISMSTDKHVTVKGNAGDFAGSFMRKGTLVIEGSVGACMGYQMTGGRIVLNGVGYRRERK